jgi:putative membrane protein
MAEDTFIREQLALERTVLANERTLLSYVRTGLGLAISGGAAIDLLEGSAADILGVVLLAAAGLVMALGLWRFSRFRRRIGAYHRTIEGLPTRREPSP